jgi:hypothetical protein
MALTNCLRDQAVTNARQLADLLSSTNVPVMAAESLIRVVEDVATARDHPAPKTRRPVAGTTWPVPGCGTGQVDYPAAAL